jgi:hypothetical protein
VLLRGGPLEESEGARLVGFEAGLGTAEVEKRGQLVVRLAAVQLARPPQPRDALSRSLLLWAAGLGVYLFEQDHAHADHRLGVAALRHCAVGADTLSRVDAIEREAGRQIKGAFGAM